jgi:formylglycine-generating enzyme required for sulfatase activity
MAIHLSGKGETILAGLELAGAALLEIEKYQPELNHQQAKRLVATLSDQSLSAPGVVRARAGDTLARLGDPRLAVTTLEAMEFCLVPSGSFRMGSQKKDDPDTQDNEKPHEVKLPDYWISLFPVTNAQFNVFVNAGGYGVRKYWKEAQDAKVWQSGKVKGYFDKEPRERPMQFGEPFGLLNHPVVGITWYEALAFTRWLTEIWQQQGFLPKDWKVLLPSEAEWEKAARGGLKLPENPVVIRINNIVGVEGLPPLRDNPRSYRIYPWEGGFDPDKANIGETGIGSTSAVGCFPGGASPYGVLDMSGNVWEWTRGLYKDYPYDTKDGRENLDSSDRRVLRGGAFYFSRGGARCASRFRLIPDFRFDDRGFRVVVSPA